ncbi:MAG: MBL fold metallo-hydrolase [Candidatus Methanodesulfokora sp.]
MDFQLIPVKSAKLLGESISGPSLPCSATSKSSTLKLTNAFTHPYLLLLVLLILFISCMFLFTSKGPQAERNVSRLRLVVLVDNYRKISNIRTAWGLSIYVETPSSRLLFDTGPDPRLLQDNSRRLGINLSSIDAVVISHEHGDHVGGLSCISAGTKVYVPRGSSLRRYVERIGLRLVEINETEMISDGIYVIKPLYGPPWEEAMAIKTKKGLVIIVGCSHPGVINIVRKAVEDIKMRPYIVIGGFHMAGASPEEISSVVEELLSLGVSRIYPIHCSGDGIRSYLARFHPENYGDGGAGLEIEVDG